VGDLRALRAKFLRRICCLPWTSQFVVFRGLCRICCLAWTVVLGQVELSKLHGAVFRDGAMRFIPLAVCCACISAYAADCSMVVCGCRCVPDTSPYLYVVAYLTLSLIFHI